MHVHHSPACSQAGLGRVRGRAELAGSRAGQLLALGLPCVSSGLGCSKALYGFGRGAPLRHPLAGLALPAGLPGPQTTVTRAAGSWWISMASCPPAFLPPRLLFSFPKKAEPGRRVGQVYSDLGKEGWYRWFCQGFGNLNSGLGLRFFLALDISFLIYKTGQVATESS